MENLPLYYGPGQPVKAATLAKNPPTTVITIAATLTDGPFFFLAIFPDVSSAQGFEDPGVKATTPPNESHHLHYALL